MAKQIRFKDYELSFIEGPMAHLIDAGHAAAIGDSEDYWAYTKLHDAIVVLVEMVPSLGSIDERR